MGEVETVTALQSLSSAISQLQDLALKHPNHLRKEEREIHSSIKSLENILGQIRERKAA